MRTLGLLLVGVVIGWAASGVDWSRDAVGEEWIIDAAQSATPTTATTQPTLTQVPVNRKNSQGIAVTTWEQRPLNVGSVESTPASLIGRFQASADGSPNGHGCYIIDTMTGRTWHAANGQPPQVVACVGIQPPVNSESAYMPTPAMNRPEPMIAPTPSYTESSQSTRSTIVPQPIPAAQPTPDAAD
jgi:hypothetical protein